NGAAAAAADERPGVAGDADRHGVDRKSVVEGAGAGIADRGGVGGAGAGHDHCDAVGLGDGQVGHQRDGVNVGRGVVVQVVVGLPGGGGHGGRVHQSPRGAGANIGREGEGDAGTYGEVHLGAQGAGAAAGVARGNCAAAAAADERPRVAGDADRHV